MTHIIWVRLLTLALRGAGTFVKLCVTCWEYLLLALSGERVWSSHSFPEGVCDLPPHPKKKGDKSLEGYLAAVVVPGLMKSCWVLLCTTSHWHPGHCGAGPVDLVLDSLFASAGLGL